MALITEIADKFFVACETGKGWEACKAYCTSGATFAAQAEPLREVKSLQQYCDWMKGPCARRTLACRRRCGDAHGRARALLDPRAAQAATGANMR
jgi:hypothetical protein